MRLMVCGWPDNPDQARCPFEKPLELENGRPCTSLPVMIRIDDQKEHKLDCPARRAEAAIHAGVVPLEAMERELVQRAMRISGDNQTHASEMLGITRDQLRYRLKKFGLVHENDAA